MELENDAYFALVEEQLAAGLQVSLPLRGISMKPLLREGDVLVLSPLHGQEATVGDVVLFRYGHRHILHRIVGIDDGGYTLQGDNAYTTESAARADLLARLVEVRRPDGRRVATDSAAWRCLSRCALVRKRFRNVAVRWLGRRGRNELRPWYFGLLAILMWAPLNGLGVPLDNYILGLRTDHLLHASVFLPCALFTIDLFRRHRLSLAWLAAVAVGLLTEGVQYLLPWRGFDVNDLIANTLGTTLGWMAILVMKRHIRR